MQSLTEKCNYCGMSFGFHHGATNACPIAVKEGDGFVGLEYRYHKSRVFEPIPDAPSNIEEIKAKLEAHRHDLSCLTPEERSILSADGVAKLRGPLEAAAAKVRKAIEDTRPNKVRASKGYAALCAHDQECGIEGVGLEERLTALLANLMHVCHSTGQPEIFMQALHMANTHFAAEINQD